MNRSRYEIADIIRRFAKQFTANHNPNAYHMRVLDALTQCRTSSLGGHADACDCCGQIRISYNSCRNRHCPKCQSSKQAFWVEDLLLSTLEVKHYHIVFTVPEELNDICLSDSSMFYGKLFCSVWDTLRTFGYTRFGVESGAVCVLHTWGQNLSLHPHVHCIVPSGGLSLAGNWKNIGAGGKFLYPVAQLSVHFRSHFMKCLKAWLKNKNLLTQYQSLLDKAWGKPWVVFCEPSLAKAEHVVKYLGQYIHRVAISNNRILDVDKNNVTFLHKDYADNAVQKPITLDGAEFLRRFCMHILPRRFVKIRRYGIYSSRYKVLKQKPASKLTIKESSQERLLRLTGFDVYLCPVCKKGHMHTFEELPKIRSPTTFYAIICNIN
jgi:Putative transposase/Transposase zinc-binding domain